MTATPRQGLYKKWVLTDAELTEIRQLARICQEHESLELRLNWDALALRSGDRANEHLYYRDDLLTVENHAPDDLLLVGRAFMQDYKKTEAKQRLFGDVRAGKVRFLIGSSETMGTGVNAQLRLKALHHLDVP